MRALIVNNGQYHPTAIVRMMQDFDCSIVPVAEITSATPTNYDVVVLTGSSQRPIAYSREALTPALTWIASLTLPTLGICYGAQLIATAFGASLSCVPSKEERHRGFYTIPLSNTPNWQFPPLACLYEGHQWQIDNAPYPLEPLVTTARGVIMFEHTSRPLVGMQFHPEKYNNETDGRYMFKLFCQRVVLPLN